jgi:hypothetical protein
VLRSFHQLARRGRSCRASLAGRRHCIPGRDCRRRKLHSSGQDSRGWFSHTKRAPLQIEQAASVVCVDAATPNWETWASVSWDNEDDLPEADAFTPRHTPKARGQHASLVRRPARSGSRGGRLDWPRSNRVVFHPSCEGFLMKKTYQQPTLVRRSSLTQITAVTAIPIGSIPFDEET